MTQLPPATPPPTPSVAFNPARIAPAAAPAAGNPSQSNQAQGGAVGQHGGQGTPSAAPAATPTTAGSASAPSDAAVTLSGAIADLANGEPLPATVAIDAKGRPILMTPEGAFLAIVQSGTQLPPPGTAVLLRLLQSDGRLRALAETLGGDGEQVEILLQAIADAPSLAAPPSPRLAALPLPESLKALAAAAERLIVGSEAEPSPATGTVAAEIIGSDADGRVEVRIGADRFALGPLADGLPAGRSIDLQVFAARGALRAVVVAPDGRPTGAPVPLVPLRGSETLALAAAPGRVVQGVVIAGPEGAQANLAPGTAVAVRFGAASAVDARQVQALVVRGDLAGAGPRALVVRTPVGLVRLDGVAPLPPGTPLNLEISALDATRATRPLPTLPAAADLPPLAQRLAPFLDGWPALDEAIAAVAASSPEMAARAAEAAVAAPGPRMPTTFALFLAAMRFGDVSGWLGTETVAALRTSGRATLVKRLGDDLKSLADLSSVPDAEGWRATPLPFAAGGPIQPLVLYTRRGPAHDAEGATTSTRFMIEISLSALGPLQLDGMVSGHRCDLMVRTVHPLDDEVRGGIVARYGETLALTGRVGHVGFQTLPSLPPLPPERGSAKSAGAIHALSV
jgi:hypothetical protein